MPDYTYVHDIPYPTEMERPDVPADMQSLANRVDEILNQRFTGTGAPPNVGDTLPDGTTVAVLRHKDVYYRYTT